MVDIGADTPQSPAWANGFVALRQEMDAWIAASSQFHKHVPFLGVHDEGSFIASWLCHYQLTRDPGIIEFARFLRDGFAQWAESNLLHGFFPEGEVHHQTEIFNNFLLRLWHVAPDDLTAKLILDAAEHIGNWVPGLPEWYDWNEDRFLGWHIGTERAGDDDPFEVPDHFRLIQLALGAYLICGDDRYLDLSTRWTTRWASAIIADPDEPLDAMLAEGVANASIVRAAQGAAHAGPGKAGKVEPYVAAGAIDVLLDLHSITDDPLYANAARVLCALLVDELADPHSNPPGAILHRYRLQTQDTSLDARILGQLAGASGQPSGAPVMLVDEIARGPIPGIGKRSDMVRWGYREEDGSLVPEDAPSPSALMLGYQITGSTDFADRALTMAAGRLRLARQSLRDGRRHGCSARSIGAVASGHGRDSGYGNVTGCFYALAHGAVKHVGHERPALSLTDGDAGLPAEAAALTRVIPGVPPTAALWCDGQLSAVTAPDST